MIINICGDFTTVGKGLAAVGKGIALSDKIVRLFKASDLNIVNLESPVVSNTHEAIQKSGPNIYTSEISIEYLKKCGINLVTLANNHFYDYGKHGIKKTLDTLKANDINYVGGGLFEDEYSKIFYFEKDDVKIAILNFCESEFSVAEKSGSNPIDPIHVYRTLQMAKQNSDYRIVICHGGHEGYQLPSPRMKNLYHFFIEVGADIVCNHHQHCFSGWEEYLNGKIFYGLGNFFFYDHRPLRQRSPIWNYGYIVSLNVSKGNISSNILPYSQCKHEIMTELLNGEEKNQFENELSNLSAIIKDDLKLSISFNEWCTHQYNNMRTWFSPYSNRLLMALCRRNLIPNFLTKKKKLQLYNCIRCESHRDVAIKALNSD